MSGKGRGDLEHLDKSYAEVQVRFVTADQRQREKEPDWRDRAHIDLARHLNIVSSVQQRRRARQQPRCQSRKDQVPCRQEYSCSFVSNFGAYEDRDAGCLRKATESQREYREGMVDGDKRKAFSSSPPFCLGRDRIRLLNKIVADESAIQILHQSVSSGGAIGDETEDGRDIKSGM
jgi:hypothetical protein